MGVSNGQEVYRRITRQKFCFMASRGSDSINAESFALHISKKPRISNLFKR